MSSKLKIEQRSAAFPADFPCCTGSTLTAFYTRAATPTKEEICREPRTGFRVGGPSQCRTNWAFTHRSKASFRAPNREILASSEDGATVPDTCASTDHSVDFRAMIDSIPTLVYTMTPACELEFVNRQVIEYFGQTIDALKDWEKACVVHPDDLPAVKESLRRTIEFEEPHEVQQRLRRRDGEYRWFQPRALPLRDAGGRITRWFAVLNDIEDLRRAKEATLAREADFRQIVNTLPGLIATMKATGEVEFVNNRILEYTGWPPERFSDWRPLVHPDDVDAVVEKWVRSLETGAPYDSTHRLLGADGAYRWFQNRGVALLDAAGRRLRWFFLLSDLEDHVRAQEDLRESQVSSIL